MNDSQAIGVDFETVRRIALSFPGVEEAYVGGGPVFRARKKYLASGSREGLGVIALKIDNMQAEFLIEAEPETYYLTDHYRGWGVLIRLSKISEATLRHHFETAWRKLAQKRDLNAYDQSKKD